MQAKFIWWNYESQAILMSVSKVEEADNCVESIPPVQLDTLSKISFLLLLSLECLGSCVKPMELARSQPSLEEAIDRGSF